MPTTATRRWVVALTGLGSLMAPLDTLVVATALTTIRTERSPPPALPRSDPSSPGDASPSWPCCRMGTGPDVSEVDPLSSAEASPGTAQVALLAKLMDTQRQAGADLVSMLLPTPQAAPSPTPGRVDLLL